MGEVKIEGKPQCLEETHGENTHKPSFYYSVPED